jgi:predicted glycosyltransferase involved in capsule biosynthesis
MTVVDVDNTDNTESGVFVPPLQAKIELLKKAVNVDSIYDQQGSDEDLTGHGSDNEDELSRIKHMAGIHPVAQDEMGSDEPLDV